MLAQGLERAQQQRQPLTLHGQPHEQDAQALVLRVGCEVGADVDPIGDDPVAPAEEAPRRPRGGLRHGDAGVQAVQTPPRPE